MKPIRFGIIGAGGIAAKMHLPELAAQSHRARVTLIAGRKQSRLDVLKSRFDISRSTLRYEDVIADDQVDAVIVATPHPHHVRWGIEALEAGKHVLMQKPLCADLAEADAFVAAADAHPNCTVLCLPHFPDVFHALRQQIAADAVGALSGGHARTSHGGPEIYYREITQLFGEPDPHDLWFFDARQAAVGALFDMGVYAVAHLVAMMGTIRRVTAMTSTFSKPTELEDTATVVMTTATGAIATAQTSWCDPARTWEFSLHGTAGKYVVPGHGSAEATRLTPRVLDRDNAPIEEEPVKIRDPVGSAHGHFLDCIERGIQPPLSHARAARHVTEILLASLESARSGRSVEIRSTVTS